MKNKIIISALIGSLALFTASCEVKETNNYNLVEDPLLLGRIGSPFGFWQRGTKLINPISETNKGLNLPIYTTSGDHRIGGFVAYGGEAVFVFDREDLTDAPYFKSPYFSLAIGKVVNGNFNGKVYDMTKKNDGETISFEGASLVTKNSMDMSIKLGLAKEEETYETKIAANIDYGTLGNYQGEFKRINLNPGSFTKGSNYYCWGKTDGDELEGNYHADKVRNGMKFTVEIDDSNNVSLNHTKNTELMVIKYNDCDISLKNIQPVGIYDNGLYRVNNGNVSNCQTRKGSYSDPKIETFLNATNYNGYALFYNDKRLTIWMASAADGASTRDKPLVLECYR